METKVFEIADGIFRFSTLVAEIAPPAGFSFNQFLVMGDEPLLFHTGPRRLFPLVREAMAKVMDPAQLRWISFGHVEADECGSMNDWLALAPQAQVAHGQIGCDVQLRDLCDKPPRVLENGETIEVGGRRRLRWIDTPHTPHAWDAGVLFEEDSGTLLCGDLFTQIGNGQALVTGDILGPAIAAEEMFQYASLHPDMGRQIRGLAGLSPRKLALMHGPSWEGDGAAALSALADFYDRRRHPAN
jgi:flavorubredoxin